MKELGLRNKNGNPIAFSSIERILRNPFYYGVMRSKKYGHSPHHYQPIITKELFDKCQDVLDDRSKKPSKQTSKPFIFKGLVTCKNCGCLMTPEIHKGRFIYYSCTNAKKICKKEYIPEKRLL